MTVKDLIQTLTESYSPEDHVAAHIWATDDVQEVAEELKVKLIKEETEEIIDDINENIDSEFGISWDTLRYKIQDFVERRENHG